MSFPYYIVLYYGTLARRPCESSKNDIERSMDAPLPGNVEATRGNVILPDLPEQPLLLTSLHDRTLALP